VEDALLAFETGRHHLIMTDYALGVRTGFDLARAVRNQHPNQAIILVSAYVGTLELNKNGLTQFNAALSKPFTLLELNEALAMVFPDPSRSELNQLTC
jgi:CheY-like chemotaxis protein